MSVHTTPCVPSIKGGAEIPRAKRKNYRDRFKEEKQLSPLSLAILERLPEEGATAGLRWLAASVSRLLEDLRKLDPNITTNEVSAEMRSLHVAGYVHRVQASSMRTSGWQRTGKGKEAVNGNTD